MKKVSFQLNRIITYTSITLFALIAVLVLPTAVMASTYSYDISDSNSTGTSTSASVTYSRSYTYDLSSDSSSSNSSSADTDKNDSVVLPDSNSSDSSKFKVSKSYSYDLTTIETEPTDPPVIEPPIVEPPVEEQSVRVETLASGTKYATDLYIIESGKPGPVVMIVGGVHGNEPAGFTAAKRVTDWEIEKGTLLVLPEANKRADERDVRYVKGEGDLNRDFPQSSSESADNTLSRSIWSAVKEYDVEWLMDMHEGYDYYKNKSTDSVGQSLIYYPNKGTYPVASEIVNTLNKGISSSYKDFSLLKYPVKGSLARSTGQYLGVHSFIFETCDNPSLSTRVNYQLKAAEILLEELDMM